ncbi:hypothetical protein F0562_008042 [Nyssa sinensis]|uniref:K-box domain-containing protein n=1 Tax=Nyssa sinensis TaxID=561372 RepID=A0A5J5A7I9_9ASTE|nr:hypothetical protein F0562_008042 [Nyssa sinensis]
MDFGVGDWKGNEVWNDDGMLGVERKEEREESVVALDGGHVRDVRIGGGSKDFWGMGVRSTIERYKKACVDSSNPGSISEANTQFYQQEATKLKRQIRDIQNSNRHIVGDALSSLTFKELKNLEGRLERAISRIRSKKNELLFSEVELMQKREIELQNANMYLREKIAETERAQQQMQIAENERAQQQMNLMPGSKYHTMGSQPYDARGFLPVNLLDPNHHYSHQDHTALQLV